MRVYVDIPVSRLKEIDAVAEASGSSRNLIIREAITEYLSKGGRKKTKRVIGRTRRTDKG